MRIGFDAYTIAGRGLSVGAILDFARAHRLEDGRGAEEAVLGPVGGEVALALMHVERRDLELHGRIAVAELEEHDHPAWPKP